jgi:hypothetical protein
MHEENSRTQESEVRMSKKHHGKASSVVALALACLLAWPAVATAQLGGAVQLPPLPIGGISTTTVVGSAQAVQATLLGITTALADTGTLGSTSDAREASQVIGSIPNVLGGEALHAVTIGWPDQVASEASVANLGMSVGGVRVAADFVMARASDSTGAAGSGVSTIEGLSVNGVPVFVTGAPNQIVQFPGGQMVINEQTISAASSTVNALHVTVFGIADVVIASAKAGL